MKEKFPDEIMHKPGEIQQLETYLTHLIASKNKLEAELNPKEDEYIAKRKEIAHIRRVLVRARAR